MAIEARELCFTYKKAKKPVLSGFSVRFDAGESVAVTGRNGCGKTTLIKLLLGILKPDSGCVEIDGEDVSSLSLAQVGRRIGYVMQSPSQQLFCTSVRDEVEYGLKNLALPEDELHVRAAEYMRYFEIERYADSFPLSLSGGEKQRVMLAAVLAMRPRYLLLDEPSASLDVYRASLLADYLKKIKADTGCGVVVVSHDGGFIERFAERTVQMEAAL